MPSGTISYHVSAKPPRWFPLLMLGLRAARLVRLRLSDGNAERLAAWVTKRSDIQLGPVEVEATDTK
jgi:integrase